MNKYYKALELDENATEEEIKKAYLRLKRKFDVKSYEKDHLKQYAQEKTKEIDEAFEMIMNEKRTQKMREENSKKNDENFGENRFKNVEDLIDANRLQRADEILLTVPQEQRTARWFFLKGVILYRKGWLLEASNFFATAVRMDPSNEEYKTAYEKANWQRDGGFGNPQRGGPFYGDGPYQNGAPYGCDFCDACRAVLCADICCNCFFPRDMYRCC